MAIPLQEEILRAIPKCRAEPSAQAWEIVRHINVERSMAAMPARLDSKHVSDELRNMEKQGLLKYTGSAWVLG